MKVELKDIVEPLLVWYAKEKRDLPWRKTNDSYAIWISEIMLQQTRAEAVKEYYGRFLKALPTMEDLAEVEEDKLFKLWEGLGYYNRAKNLQKCAMEILKSGQRKLPKSYEELKKLPGIGPYTAASIGAIAYHQKTPAIDGNVLRVMSRLYEDSRNILDSKVRDDYFLKLSKIMPENTRDFTESLMELGALVCLPKGLPLCEKCPLSFCCHSYQKKTMLKYPVKKKECRRKIEEKTILILEYQGKVAIKKRSDTGLLASLYEFVLVEGKLSEVEVKRYLKREQILFAKIISLEEKKHVFSHLEWHMIGYHIFCKEKPHKKLIWVGKKELWEEYSLPSALSYYAKTLKM